MRRTPAIIGLVLTWLIVSGEFNVVNLVLALLVALAVLRLVRFVGVREGPTWHAVPLVGFAFWYAWRVLHGTWVVALATVAVRVPLRAAVVEVPVRSDNLWEYALLVNLVTFVPGSLAVDSSPDRQRIYVHGLFRHDENEIVAEIERLQERLVRLRR